MTRLDLDPRSLVDQLESIEAETGALLEAQSSGGGGARFSGYRDDPVGFIEDVLGETDPGMWGAQFDICESVRDEPLTVVRSCNSAGKDWLSARLALWWVYSRSGQVLMTAPTQRQLVNVVMEKEVRRAFRKAKLPGELYQTRLTAGTDQEGSILAFTSTNASAITGYHDPHGVLAIMTEAQDVPDFAYEGLLACTTGAEDRILAVGNPTNLSGQFYKAATKGHWNSIRIDARDHPNVVQGEEVIPGAVTRQFINRIKAEYGEDSAMYRMRVLGEFALASGDRLIPDPTWVERAHALTLELADYQDAHLPHPTRELRLEGHTLVIGVDVARFGEDRSCLVFRRGPLVEEIVDLPFQTRTTETTGHIIRELKARGLSKDGNYVLVVDEIGVGGGVLDELHEQGYPAYGCNFSGSPPGPAVEEFLNLRAWVYWQIRKKLEAGHLALPENGRLQEDLYAQKWSVTSAGKVKMVKKNEIRRELGRSPDYSDALALTYGLDGRASIGAADVVF